MFIALCFHRSKEKEQHAQCCSCVTLDAAQVAPQRCLILHLRESNYIIFDYQPEFNRLEKGLEELLPPLFLQWQVPVKTYWNWNLLFQLTVTIATHREINALSGLELEDNAMKNGEHNTRATHEALSGQNIIHRKRQIFLRIF